MAISPRKVSGYRVYCDESNTDGGKRHPVYGAILVALDDLPTVQREIADWRRKERIDGELKWETMRGGLRLKQYKSLVELLFSLARQRQLIQFKAIILDRHAPEYRIYSKGNDEIGFYKTYYHWLLWYFAEFPLRHRCKLRVIIDDRNLPKNAKDPFTKLKFALNNGGPIAAARIRAGNSNRSGYRRPVFYVESAHVGSRRAVPEPGPSPPRAPAHRVSLGASDL